MSGVMLKPEDLKLNAAIELPDVATLYEMSEGEYRAYVEGDNIVRLDEHGVLRDSLTSRPIATTLEQLDILLEKLDGYLKRMRSTDEGE